MRRRLTSVLRLAHPGLAPEVAHDLAGEFPREGGITGLLLTTAPVYPDYRLTEDGDHVYHGVEACLNDSRSYTVFPGGVCDSADRRG
jgi:hypothetical protein